MAIAFLEKPTKNLYASHQIMENETVIQKLINDAVASNIE